MPITSMWRLSWIRPNLSRSWLASGRRLCTESPPDDWDPLQELWPEPSAPGDGAHRLLLLQPEVKWGPERQRPQRTDLLLAEAAALVRSLPGWSVVDTVRQPVQNARSKTVLGAGQLDALSERLRRRPAVSGVLVNVEQLSGLQQASLEAALGRPVLDRYGIVLRIFRQHASSRAARLQVALAQLPYQRSRLRAAGQHSQARRHQLDLHEQRLRQALRRLEGQRDVLRAARRQSQVPVVGVVGYTNAGKTSLIGALSEGGRLRGRDQLFATLDVTAHRAAHARLRHVFLDTVGFMAHLPTALIDGFRATLSEVSAADLLLHVVDLAHPDREAQARHVIETLRQLGLRESLLDSAVTVGNKADLSTDRPAGLLCVSATAGVGLAELRRRLEAALEAATGRRSTVVLATTGGPTYSWVLKHCDLVSQEQDQTEPQLSRLTVLSSPAQLAQLRRAFPGVRLADA